MIAADIETMRDDSKIDSLPEPKIDSRLKDEAKIEAAKEKGRQEQIDNMALSPWTGKLASVAMVNGEKDCCLIVGRDGTEAEVLQSFFNTIKGSPIIGYNSMGFDVPFVYGRALLLGVSVHRPMSQLMKRYTTDPHADLMQVITNWGKDKYMSLNDASRLILGGEQKDDFDWRRIPELLEKKEYDELESYNTQDARLTFNLYQKMKLIYF